MLAVWYCLLVSMLFFMRLLELSVLHKAITTCFKAPDPNVFHIYVD